jgi:RNA polymerase sigma-70 factor (ECF subfamily)
VETALTQPAAGRQEATAPTHAARGIHVGEFDALVREHQQRIYRVLLALLRDPDAADTLTQECFLRAYRNRAGFRREARVSTWLVRIAVNLAHDHRRSRRRAFWSRLFSTSQSDAAALAAQAAADPQASPERALAAREELQAVWQAAEELSPKQRTVFLLRFGEEMTLEEIGEATGLEVGTVKIHLFRAVGAVRRKLGRREASKARRS